MNSQRRITVIPGRVRVSSRPAADERWERLGRPHFLTRPGFEHHGGSLPTTIDPRATLFSAIPLLDLVFALGLLLAPFYALWWATDYFCPPAAVLVRWIGRQFNVARRSLVCLAVRWLWTQPSQRWGAAMTAWLWLVGCAAFGTLVAAVGLRLDDLVGLLPLWLLVVGLWLVLRWWRQRRFRARVLPTRRRR